MTIDRKKFFTSVKASLFGGHLTQSQVDALEAIRRAWLVHGTGKVDQEAYVYATIYGEVGVNLLPVPENLNYRSADRIKAVWPKRFKTTRAALPYVGQPEKLANKVYANRLGNGDEASGDGWKYRGHGYQCTGRDNFEQMGERLRLDLVESPELLDENVEYAASALIIGLVEGLYTGKPMTSYLDGVDEPDDADLAEFVQARRTYNGTFNASQIGEYALYFELALRESGEVDSDPIQLKEPAVIAGPGQVAATPPVLTGLQPKGPLDGIFDTIFHRAEKALEKPTTPIDNKNAPIVAHEIAKELAPIFQNGSNTEKPWQSRIFLGLGGALLGMAGSWFGLNFVDGDIEQIGKLVTEAMTLAGVAYALYGRIVGGKKPPLFGKAK